MIALDQHQLGVDAFNALLAEIWQAEQDELRVRVEEGATEAARKNKWIQRIESVELNAKSPPLLAIDPYNPPSGSAARRLRVELPGRGAWSLAATLEAFGFHLDVRVEGLRITAGLFFRPSATPGAGGLAPVQQAELLEGSNARVAIGDLDVRARKGPFKVHLPDSIEKMIRDAVQDAIRKAISHALPTFAAVRAIADLGLADRPAPASGPPPDMGRLKSRARSQAALVVADHLRPTPPFRSLLSAVLTGAGADDPIVTYAGWQDSAIWTGHYLAAQAFRQSVVRGGEASEAADAVRTGLDLLETLVSVAGPSGLLSRVVLGADSPYAVTLRTRPAHPVFSGSFGGQTYLSEGHITRDQYVGAFLGAGMVFHLCRDEALRERAKRIALAMVEYLVDEVHWSPREVGKPPKTSVTYATTPTQVLAILQLARKLDGAKYDALFQRHRPMISVGWLFQWLDTLDPHSHYYKFNLEHSMALLLLGLEEDPAVRAELAQGFRTMRRALRYHANAYFNLVELTVFRDAPELLSRPQGEIEEETRHLMAAWLERPAVDEPLDLTHDPAIEKVRFLGLDKRKKSDAETIARMPVPVEHRPGTDFLWQRSPFELVNLYEKDIRPPGVDLLLPYWMGRKLGVFTAS